MLRSKIILAAVDGSMNAGVAAEISVRIHTVRKWRRRFCRKQMAGLADPSDRDKSLVH
jgi:hypothetical protein